MSDNKFGIYFNADLGQIVRINSPYWIPEEPDWVFVTDRVNATLIEARTIIEEKKLFELIETIHWGSLLVSEN